MYELVKHRLVPNIDHPPPFKGRSQSMRTKRSQCDCQEAKRSCDSKKRNRTSSYYVIPSEVEESQNFVWLLPIRRHSRQVLRLTGR